MRTLIFPLLLLSSLSDDKVCHAVTGRELRSRIEAFLAEPEGVPSLEAQGHLTDWWESSCRSSVRRLTRADLRALESLFQSSKGRLVGSLIALEVHPSSDFLVGTVAAAYRNQQDVERRAMLPSENGDAIMPTLGYTVSRALRCVHGVLAKKYKTEVCRKVVPGYDR